MRRRFSRWLLVFISLLVLWSAPTSAYLVATTDYLADGTTDDRNIALPGVTWTPIAAFIKCEGTQHPLWATSATVPQAIYFGSSSNWVSNRIQAFSAGVVQIGTGAEVSPAGVTCYVIAFGDDANQDIEVGTYSGDGVNGTPLPLTRAFESGLLMIRHTTGGSTVTAFRTAGMGGDVTALISGANISDAIESITATGATLGQHASVNTLGQTYAYVAIKAIPGANDSDSYPGDATADGLVATVANPVLSLFKVTGVGAATCSRWGTVGDLSWVMVNTAATTNQIKAYQSDGILTGSAACVDQSGVTVHWWATTQPTYGRRRAAPVFF
jgi:hypothetical protein